MTDQIEQLSEREREILKQVATGASNQQIAADLNISINTVKVHIRNIFGKLGVASRTEATLFAVRSGLVKIASESENGNTAADTTTLVAPAIEVSQQQPMISDVAPLTSTGASMNEGAAPQPRGIVLHPALLALIALLAAFLGAGMAVLLIGLADRPAADGSATGPTAELPAAAAAYPFPAGERSERWSALPALPDNLEGAAATSLGGQIYIIGGARNDAVVGDVWRYDPAAGNWQEVAAKPTPVRDAQAITLNGQIYVPGGFDDTGRATDVVEVFDPAQGWTAIESLPAPRAAYSIAELNGQLYLFGGLADNQEHSDVFRYDTRDGVWHSDATEMPTARAYSGAVAIEGRIFVFGGERDGAALNTTEQYIASDETNGNPWSIRAPLPEPRGRFGIGNINNQVYLFGGNAARPMVRYDFRGDRWEPVASDVSPGLQPAVANRDASLYLVINGGPGRSNSDFFQFEQVFTVRVTVP